MAKYAIGLDYGTLSVRALLIDIETGREAGVSVFNYPHGVMEKELPTGELLPNGFALQHPQDYIDGLIYVITNVMKQSKVKKEDVVGIGIDFTASTVLPVKKDGTPLCMTKEFEREPHAYVKLWKHHGGEEEATYIDKTAKEKNEEWLSLYGGKISAEWMLPKVLETLNQAPKVYEKAERYIEAMDWIAWNLIGEDICSANVLCYKGFVNYRTGYPSKEFLQALDPRMQNLYEEKFGAPQKRIGETAGILTKEMAEKLGLCEGTPVGTPIIDSHSGVLGGGIIEAGEMMIMVGTSFCHLVYSQKEEEVKGICTLAKEGILPNYYAYEAGQSGGGDIYAWFTKNCVPEKYEIEAREKGVGIHRLLCEKLKDYKAGQSGLLALDWFNGVRSPLMDYNLNGLLLGMNLQTKPEEIYLALIEATAFGTRLIIEEFEKSNISIDKIVLSGGIPLKNPMLVQVYSDILNREISVCPTTQAGALGAAILGVAAATPEVTGYNELSEIVEKLGKRGDKIYYPNTANVGEYDKLFAEYKILHEYFGKGMNDVMRHLNALRK